MIKNNKSYLGDSVYAYFDGFGVRLTTEQGDNIPSNIIYLEPDVIQNLNQYYKRMTEEELDV